MSKIFMLNCDEIILREMIPNDIENYVKWYLYDKEWEEWDAPWERVNFKEEQIKIYFFSTMLKQRQQNIKSFLQIETKSGEHIGWVSSYEINGEEDKLAVGVTIPPIEKRCNGYGKKAITMFIEYLLQYYPDIYMETWSGNERMMNVANKIGFYEVDRQVKFWNNNGKYYDSIKYILDKNSFFSNYTILNMKDKNCS